MVEGAVQHEEVVQHLAIQGLDKIKYKGRESSLSSNSKVNQLQCFSAGHHPRPGSWADHFKSDGPQVPRGLVGRDDLQIRSSWTIAPIVMFEKLKAHLSLMVPQKPLLQRGLATVNLICDERSSQMEAILVSDMHPCK